MNSNVYAIFDTASGAFMQPFFMPNDGMAIRAFSDHVNAQEPNNVKNHPEHFSLYRVGTWNDASGDLNPEDPARRLITANELVQREKQEVPTVDLAALSGSVDQIKARLDFMSEVLQIDELKENK